MASGGGEGGRRGVRGTVGKDERGGEVEVRMEERTKQRDSCYYHGSKCYMKGGFELAR